MPTKPNSVRDTIPKAENGKPLKNSRKKNSHIRKISLSGMIELLKTEVPAIAGLQKPCKDEKCLATGKKNR
jgi:hypothetical protein